MSTVPWTPQDLNRYLGAAISQLHLRMPQVQLLLAQERFVARLYQLPRTDQFIWKGSSLLIRTHVFNDTPRFTVDLDFTLQHLDANKVKDVFEEAAQINLNDGFKFDNIRVKPMQRDTPYGGDRFEIDWTLFDKGQSDSLKIDVCAGDVVDSVEMSSNVLFIADSNDDLSIKIYPPEYIFAEKLETAFRFGIGYEFMELIT